MTAPEIANIPDGGFGWVLVRGGEVYGPEPRGRQDVLIGGGRVVAIGADLTAPNGLGRVRMIDAAGRRVVPGFVDAHVHILGGGGQGGPQTRNRDLVLTDATRAGATTLVGCLGMDAVTRHVSSLVAKARALDREGLTVYASTGAYAVPTPTLTGSITSDLTFVERIIAVGEIAISDHRSSQPTHEELARLTADARLGGMYGDKAGVVIFHVGEGRGGLAPLRRLIEETDLPPSQFLPTHTNRTRRVWDEALQYALAGGAIDVTAGVAPVRGFPASVKPSEAVAEALAAGVPPARLTMSSDANGNMPFYDEDGRMSRVVVQAMTDLTEEFRDMVHREGVPLETALRVVSTTPAERFGLGGTKGRLAAGSDADLVVLTEALGVETVIARGRVLLEHGVPAVKGLFE